MLHLLSTLVFFVAFCGYYVEGLTCYGCSYTRVGDVGGDLCLEEPWNVTTANTVKCTQIGDICITRGIYSKEAKAFNSLIRTCGTYAAACSEDTDFITCSVHCSTEFCNDQKLSIPGVDDGGKGDGMRLDGRTTVITIAWVLSMSILQ